MEDDALEHIAEMPFGGVVVTVLAIAAIANAFWSYTGRTHRAAGQRAWRWDWENFRNLVLWLAGIMALGAIIDMGVDAAGMLFEWYAGYPYSSR